MFRSIHLFALVVLLVLVGCATPVTPVPATGAPIVAPSPAVAKATLNVLATETFIADIAQNVAGDRLKVNALLPIGVDPHAFEPTPNDVRRVADSNLIIANGAGFEDFLDKLLKNAGGSRTVVEAATGLTSRKPKDGEPVDPDLKNGDPHFWFDPNYVVQYVENIRDGLSKADPAGASAYAANATAYIAKLKQLDQSIADQVEVLPVERRLLVTDHDTFGYFADRYGFRIVGMIVPNVSTGASPSAQQVARLVQQIKAAQAKAIFLEASTNPQLAQQIAKETGAKVVTGLRTHSITEANGSAPNYIAMMQFNVKLIVDALK